MSALPGPTPVTSPLDETDAANVFVDCQVASPVTFRLDPSVNNAVAVICRV
jgi:hypothetical protein